MPPRASWTGNLKLSLISIPVRLYRAVSSSGRLSLRMLHQDCSQRVRYQYTCPVHGELDKDQIVKGYEFERGKYVVVDDETLDKIRLETTQTIEVVQFIDQAELDPIYLDTPYYLSPDGPVAEEGFQVIRKALEKTGKAAIGRVVMSNRELMVAISPRDTGLFLQTLHYQSEVRGSEAFFEGIPGKKVDPEEVELAESLIEKKSEAFDPSQFKDRYEEALTDVIKAKIQGEEVEVVEEREAGKVVNFMDALKRSVAEEEKSGRKKTAAGKKPPARSVKRASSKEKKKEKGGSAG